MTFEEKRQFCICDDKNRIKKLFDFKIIEYIKNHYDLFVLGDTLYIYVNGVFVIDFNEMRLASVIKSMIPDVLVNANNLTRIIKLIFLDVDLVVEADELNDYPDYWIPFSDCFYDVMSGEKIEHSPKYKLMNILPCKCPVGTNVGNGDLFEKFIHEAVGEDDIETILEFIGLCMTKNNKFQKMLILNGTRGTGKSVLLTLLSDIVGEKNISNVPLQKIGENFFAIQLMNKFVNVCADLPSVPLRDNSKIKQISGGDVISDSFKGCDVVFFRPYCKLVFSCNSLPVSLDEKTDAFFNRLIVVKMENKPKTVDRDLNDKLKKEIPYIVTKCLQELRKAFDDGFIHESDSSLMAVKELYKISDSVLGFLEDCTTKTEKSMIKTSELYGSYKNYCSKEERACLSRNSFYKNMSDKGYCRKTVHGVQYFDEIGWKSDSEISPKTSPRVDFSPVDDKMQIPFAI